MYMYNTLTSSNGTYVVIIRTRKHNILISCQLWVSIYVLLVCETQFEKLIPVVYVRSAGLLDDIEIFILVLVGRNTQYTYIHYHKVYRTSSKVKGKAVVKQRRKGSRELFRNNPFIRS